MRSYLGAVMRNFPAEVRIESSPKVIDSPLNGGARFAGKSGRKTANVCDTNAMETNMDTAAHFMSAALSRFIFAISGFGIFFLADATVRIPCPRRPGKLG